MRRSLLILILTASCLHATSYTFTFCSAGEISLSPCNSNLNLDSGGLVGPNYLVRTYAAVPDPLFATATMSALAIGMLDSSTGAPPLFGIAGAGDTMTYGSQGPPRVGIIQFNVGLYYLHESSTDAATVTFTDGVHSYYFFSNDGGSIPPTGQCFSEQCLYAGMLPFQLGSQFSASASVLAIASSNFGASQAVLDFSLFEADGTTPVAFFATPEPFPGGLQIVGLSLIGCALWKRRSASKRKSSALGASQPS
jgi:hypothetical protein